MFLLKKESVLGLHQEKARNFKFQRCELIDPSVEVCGDRIFAASPETGAGFKQNCGSLGVEEQT